MLLSYQPNISLLLNWQKQSSFDILLEHNLKVGLSQMLDSKLLFFFGALGAFNAFLLGIFFGLIKKNRSTTDYLLGILLLFFSVRVGISCIYYFGPVPAAVVQSGQVANLLIGPALFFFVRSAKTKHAFSGSDYLHISLLTLGIAWLWIFFDFDAWNYPIRFTLHAILTAYLLMTFVRWRKFLLGDRLNVLARIVFWASILSCLGFAASLVSSYILGPLVFSVILYVSIGLAIKAERSSKSSYKQKIDSDQSEKLLQRLKALMEQEKLYQDPNLKLETLAKSLSISKHLLSQLLNDNLQKSFNKFVNEYRIESACQLLENDKPFSMEAIGYEVGFHSRSSFFATFKKIKGTTPSRFKELA